MRECIASHSTMAQPRPRPFGTFGYSGELGIIFYKVSFFQVLCIFTLWRKLLGAPHDSVPVKTGASPQYHGFLGAQCFL